MAIRYTWSNRKNRENTRKHGISFVDAARIFDGPILEAVDDRYDYGETRIQAIGLVETQEIYVVYVDDDEETRRIISARKAERHEREAYGEKFRDLSGEWDEFVGLSDEEVRRRATSDPDALPTDPSMWRHARVVMPAPKQLTSFRLDPDVLAWFRSLGKGYQTRINAVLRSYMDAHRKRRAKS